MAKEDLSWLESSPIVDDKVKRTPAELRMRAAAGLSPAEAVADEARERDPSNIQELQREINRTTDPESKRILQEHLTRITAPAPAGDWLEASPLVAPVAAAPLPSGYRVPFTSAELSPSVAAGLQGLLKGATAGLGTYGTAGMAYLADRFRGSEVPVSWAEALQATRGVQQELQQRAPVASSLGQLAGAVGLGLRMPMGTIPQAIGAGAGTGAITGFTERDSLRDAAIGAGVGGAMGGALGGFGTAAGAIMDRFVTKPVVISSLKESIQQNKAALKEIKAARREGLLPTPVLNPTGQPVRASEAIRAFEAAKPEQKLIGNLKYLQDRLATAKKTPASEFRSPTSTSLGGEPLGSGPMTNLAWLREARLPKATNQLTSNLLTALPGAGIGATLGAGQALLTGGNPLQGAMYGAGLGSFGLPLARGVAARYGTQLAPAGVAALGGVARPAIEYAVPEVLPAQPRTFSSYEDYLAAFEAAPTIAEKRALGEAYQAQFGLQLPR